MLRFRLSELRTDDNNGYSVINLKVFTETNVTKSLHHIKYSVTYKYLDEFNKNNVTRVHLTDLVLKD